MMSTTRAEFIKEELEEEYPGCRFGQDLDIIVQQTERIADITHSILHYARKPSNGFAALDLNEVVRHSVKIMQPRIRKCRAAIVLELLDEQARIWGSFSQLEQVFCNLINNSLDAMAASKGRIEITILRATANPEKLSFWRKIGFGVGDIYGGGSAVVIGFYYLIFLTDVVRIRPALAGTVIVISKIYDSITDPLEGVQPPVGDLRVVVEEQDEVTMSIGGTPVTGADEAEVFLVAQEPH